MIRDYHQDHGDVAKKDIEEQVLSRLGFSTNTLTSPEEYFAFTHASAIHKETMFRHLNICCFLLNNKKVLNQVQTANLLIALRIRTKSILRALFYSNLPTEAQLEQLSENLLYLISHRDSYNSGSYPAHAQSVTTAPNYPAYVGLTPHPTNAPNNPTLTTFAMEKLIFQQMDNIAPQYPAFIYCTPVEKDGILVVKDLGLDLHVLIQKQQYTFQISNFRLLAQNLDDAYEKYFLCHRDIKLANLGLDHDGNVCLFDWGFVVSNRMTEQIVFAGTPAYLSNDMLLFLSSKLQNRYAAASYNLALCRGQDIFCFLAVVFLAYSGQVVSAGSSISGVMAQGRSQKLNIFIQTWIAPQHRRLIRQLLMPIYFYGNTQMENTEFEQIANLKLTDILLFA
jgi:hypothetical protein